jgi:hypothetical protein
MQAPPNERGRKVKRPPNGGIRKKSVRKKSARFASTFNEPIGAAANQENREGSASSGTGSGVKTAVPVAQYAACVTAFIDPVVRRHEAAVEDRANRRGRPYDQKKEKQLQLGEEHFFYPMLTRADLYTNLVTFKMKILALCKNNILEHKCAAIFNISK